MHDQLIKLDQSKGCTQHSHRKGWFLIAGW